MFLLNGGEEQVMRLLALCLVIFFLSHLPVAAEPRAAKEAVQEISVLTTDMTQFATILRLSEDISFWQSVSIMGAEYGWEFEYSAQGKDVFPWTLRLYNSLDETLSEGIAASQAIARSRVLTDEEKSAGKALFAQYEDMRAYGEQVYLLLKAGDISAAKDVYEMKVIQLRRDISISASSAIIQLRDRIKKIALDVRLGK
jgi:hypothetical protein